MPKPKTRVSEGPSLRIEREYRHLTLPTARLNVSAGTQDHATKARYVSILDQLAHAPDAQAFFQTWLSMRAGRWSVPEIAAVFAACSGDPQATIQNLLRQSLQAATWSVAKAAYKAERQRLGKLDVEKELERLDVFRRWLTANGHGEVMTDLLTIDPVRAFLTYLSVHGATGTGGVEAATQNRYRAVILMFCTFVESKWPGVCDVDKIRRAIRQASVRAAQGRALRWSQPEEQRYYLFTYAVTAAPSRGRKPEFRPDIGLALRVLVQTAMDVKDVRTKLTADAVSRDPRSNRPVVWPGNRSKTETRLRNDLSKERIVPISEELHAELLAYASQNAAAIQRRGGRLFGHLTEGALRRAHERLADAVGWGPDSQVAELRITMKDLRHNGAVRWERATRTESDISKRMGHDDPRTIRIYLRGMPPSDADRIEDEHAAAQLCPAPWRLAGTHPCAPVPEEAMAQVAATIAEAAAARIRLVEAEGGDRLEPWQRLVEKTA